ncbi:fumarylacetoacetase [Herpetosiphon sp. NSE202]|uniref:fumarylacetoacetase n=1 Tax=Herpetosiphon sp. NSE202 TaxID=3351349 RepID=UPI0036343F6B
MLNETHDPALRSWVASANQAGADFPIQNLPFGVFRRQSSNEQWRIGVAIGSEILDLSQAAEHFSDLDHATLAACRASNLNQLMSLTPAVWHSIRLQLSRMLRQGSGLQAALEPLLLAQAEAELSLPAAIGDFTDFYASIFHATNIGSMFRPDNPLLPNYKYVPIGYHGRASSIRVSGTQVKRPHGQTKAPDATVPSFGPCRLLDYELELGFWVGQGNQLGQPIKIEQAEDHVFGVCLLNDWSARDIQAWEYQPLGPFLAKNFISSISPWVVTLEALAPYRCPAFERPADDPAPLAYLDSPANRSTGGLDVVLEVSLQTATMRAAGQAAEVLSLGNFRDMYWTFGQMLTHHASNGCNLQPGDLLGSGTISGPSKDSRGCLMELTWRGQEPIHLSNGEERRFLQAGDELIIRGWCGTTDGLKIGFGECRGIVLD